MSSSVIMTCQLNNGLTVICLDHSKQIAADRWYVCIHVQMTIPVERKWFDHFAIDDEAFLKMRQKLGETVVFEQKKDRHFVSINQREEVVQSICSQVEETANMYFSHPDFAAKFIFRQFDKKKRPF